MSTAITMKAERYPLVRNFFIQFLFIKGCVLIETSSQYVIQSLQAALVRIENKTYGICRETGKLIPAGRLRAVPHATLSIEAKQAGAK